MHWKIKAAVQNMIARLPDALSYEAYYWLQRRFGDLRQFSPVQRLSAGIWLWELVREQHGDPREKVFFEVGTGRVPLVPLAFWLMGARQIITIDLNPYLKEELLLEAVQYICEQTSALRDLFGPLLYEDRLAQLLAHYQRGDLSVASLLALCRIAYIAPGDAARTPLPDNSVDIHMSYTVLEHIPPQVLRAILLEGNRLVKPGGVFAHSIDYSDHFSHGDARIPAINFLQYSDAAWARYADNRYMYMNRLRHDDYLALFEAVGHRVVCAKTRIDDRSLALLKSGTFPLHPRYQAKSLEMVACISAQIVSQQRGSAS